MKLNGTYLDGFLLPVPTAKLEEKSFRNPICSSKPVISSDTNPYEPFTQSCRLV